ncbi:MAG: TetR/AcrR family transcriptional regulator [Chloroflexi bacterium]|nr:TetR/AcrR family transcriptional regulator [Chloroflexota bacterium]
MATRIHKIVPTSTGGDAPVQRETLNIRDVLRVAAALMRQHGYHGTSMQDIADELGIRKSSLYHHIKTKQEMLFLILDESIESVSKGLFEIMDSALSPKEKLRLAIGNHITEFGEHLDSVGVLLRERASLDPEYEVIYLPKRKKYERTFQQIILDGIREGVFDTEDTKMAAFAILGMCNWMAQWYSPNGDRTPEQVIEAFTKLAERMLKG